MPYTPMTPAEHLEMERHAHARQLELQERAHARTMEMIGLTGKLRYDSDQLFVNKLHDFANKLHDSHQLSINASVDDTKNILINCGGGGNYGCLLDRLPGSAFTTTTTTPASQKKMSARDGCNGGHGSERFHPGTSLILEENNVVEPFARAPTGWHFAPLRAAVAANQEQ